jgi:hypothetical protein
MLREGPLAALLDDADIALEVMVSEASRAAQILAAQGFRAHATGPDDMMVLGLKGRPSAAAAINRALNDAGFAVSRIAFRPPTLEDLFMKLTARTAAPKRQAA